MPNERPLPVNSPGTGRRVFDSRRCFNFRPRLPGCVEIGPDGAELITKQAVYAAS